MPPKRRTSSNKRAKVVATTTPKEEEMEPVVAALAAPVNEEDITMKDNNSHNIIDINMEDSITTMNTILQQLLDTIALLEVSSEDEEEIEV